MRPPTISAPTEGASAWGAHSNISRRRNTSPVAWLFRIARNATTDHFRAHGRRERLRRTIEHQPVATDDPARMAEERLQYRALLAHVARLPERQRDALSLRHSGLSFEEVGVLMSCTE